MHHFFTLIHTSKTKNYFFLFIVLSLLISKSAFSQNFLTSPAEIYNVSGVENGDSPSANKSIYITPSSVYDTTVVYTIRVSVNKGQSWQTQSTNGYSTITMTGFNMSTPGLYEIWAEIEGYPHTLTIKYVYLTNSSLSGVYKIGEGPIYDFKNLRMAQEILKKKGMSGSVSFKLSAGLYQEVQYFDSIPGSNANNSISISSISGNPDVVFTSPPSGSTPYLLKFRKVYNVSLRNLVFKPVKSVSRVVYFDSGTVNISVRKCQFSFHNTSNSISWHLMNTVEYHGLVLVDSCRFKNGKRGIGMYNLSSILGTSSVTITNNIVEGFNDTGISAGGGDSTFISNNKVYSTLSGYTYGMNISTDYYALIEKNKILAYHITLRIGCDTSAHFMVRNNMITSIFNYGVFFVGFGDVYFYNNTVLVDSSNSNMYSACLHHYGYTHVKAKNNNIVNYSQGYAVRNFGANSFDYDVFSHNNIYTNGSTIAKWMSGSATTFTNLQSLATIVQNCVSIAPNFYAPNDLHTNTSAINNIGTPLTLVTTDIDGQTRNTTNPDLGCDEFDVVSRDIGLRKLNITNLNSTGFDAELIYTNYGTQAVSSFLIPITVDDTIRAFPIWTGTLLPGQTDTLNIGHIAYMPYFSIKAIVSSVNGSTDLNPTNDTLEKVYNGLPLQGSYIVGNSPTADFYSISEATYNAQYSGIKGDVFFNVLPGTYNENISFNQNIKGCDNTSHLIIRPQSNQPNSIKINGNVVIKNTSFVNISGFSFKEGLVLVENSNHISISNCDLSHWGTLSYKIRVIIKSSDSISFNSSKVSIGLNAIHVSNSPRVLIANNTIKQFRNEGIVMGNCPNFNIKGNTISHIKSDDPVSGSTNSTHAIIITYANGGTIDGNKINFQSSSYNKKAIKVTGISYSTSTLLTLKNNMIIDYSGSAAVWFEYLTNVKLYHNTIYSRGYCTYFYNNGPADSKNNIFYSYNSNIGATSGDYHNFYSDTPILFGQYATLSALQQATGGYYHCVSTNPLFIDKKEDLYISNTTLASAGLLVSSAATDIDGNPRTLGQVTIGANQLSTSIYNLSLDEITFPSSICASGYSPLKINLKNLNLGIIDTIDVFYQLDTNAIDSIRIIHHLTLGQKLNNVIIDSLYLTEGKHSLQVWANIVGASDAVIKNNYKELDLNVYNFPNARITMDTLHLVFNNCTSSMDTSFTISNTGGANLELEIDTNRYTNQAGALKIAYIAETTPSNYNQDGYITNAIAQDIPGAVLTTMVLPTTAQFEQLCRDNDVVIFSPEIDYYYYNYKKMWTYLYPINNLIASGGTVIYLSPSITKARWIFEGGFWKGYAISGHDGMLSQYNVDYSDPVFNGLNANTSFNSPNWNTCFKINEPCEMLAEKGGYGFIIRKKDNLGQAYLMGFAINYNYYTNKLKLITNAIKTAHKKKTFISSTLTSAIVSLGANVTIPLHIDIQGSMVGSVINNFYINSNNYPNKVLKIPVAIDISGSASFDIDKDTIDFGAFYYSTTITDSIEIFNNGCDTLFIDSVQWSNSKLTQVNAINMIEHHSSAFIKFSYQTITTDTFNIPVTLSTSDYDTIIHIKGHTFGPPVLTHNGLTIQTIIANCADSIDVPITLKNTGAYPLTYTISNYDPNNIKVLGLDFVGSSTGNYRYSDIKGFIRSMPNVSFDTIVTNSVSVVNNMMDNYDILVIPSGNYSTDPYNTTAFQNLFKEYLRQGGTLLLMPQSYNSYFTSNSLLYSTQVTSTSATNVFISDYTSPLVAGFTGTLAQSNTQRNWLLSNYHPVIKHYKTGSSITTATALVFTRDYGTGHYVYIGGRYHKYSSSSQKINIIKLYENTINYLVTKKNGNINLNSNSGTINPGDSTTVVFTISSVGLETGNYQFKTELKTNTVNAPSSTITINYDIQNHLNVTPNFLGNDTSTCSSVFISAPSGYNYLWSNNQTSQTINIVSSGDFWCKITKNSVCSQVDTIHVSQGSPPTVFLVGINPDYCKNAAPQQFYVAPAGGIITGNTDNSYIIHPDSFTVGTHTIKYVYTSTYGCSDSVSVSFDILGLPNVNLSIPANLCLFDTITNITATPSGGSMNYAQSYSNGKFYPIKIGSGNKTIIYNYTDPNTNCSTSDTSNIYIYPRTTSTSNVLNKYCNNTAPLKLTSSIPGGHFSGTLVSNDSLVQSQAILGPQKIYYHFTDNNSCYMLDTFSTNIVSAPILTFNSSGDTICWGDSLQLVTYAPNSIFSGTGVWNNVLHASVLNAGPTEVFFTNTNSDNCTSSDSAILYINQEVLPNLGNDTTVSGGAPIILNPGNYYSYLWSSGDSSTTLAVDTSGIGFDTLTVSVIVNDNHNCSGYDTINIIFLNNISYENLELKETNIIVYPNPANKRVFIEDKGNSPRIEAYQIYNSSGSLVNSTRISDNAFTKKHTINVAHLASGTYYLILQFEHNKSSVTKIIIER